jgi:hypothetical protein
MSTREATAASTAHMVAVLCMQLVREDPGLIVRLQELVKQDKAPIEADKLNAVVIEMAEMAVTMVGQRLLHHQGPLAEFHIPVPQVEDALKRSAGALAVGSFTTEFVHSDTDRLEAFSNWLNSEHPDVIEGSTEVERGAIEDADYLLTMMAGVTSRMIEAGIKPEAGIETETYGGQTDFRDDGTRHV